MIRIELDFGNPHDDPQIEAARRKRIERTMIAIGEAMRPFDTPSGMRQPGSMQIDLSCGAKDDWEKRVYRDFCVAYCPAIKGSRIFKDIDKTGE